MYVNYFQSPLGRMIAWNDENALYYLDFVQEDREKRLENYLNGIKPVKGSNALTERLFSQLGEYFSGKRREFDIPLKLYGGTFQMAVWAGLMYIPYGETRTYGQLAAMLGKPRASRAVGGANHNNPVSVIVP